MQCIYIYVREGGGGGGGGGGVPLSGYTQMQHFTSSADNLCAAISKFGGFKHRLPSAEIRAGGDSSIQRHLHTALFRPGDAQPTSSLDRFQCQSKGRTCITRAPDLIFPNPSQTLWMDQESVRSSRNTETVRVI